MRSNIVVRLALWFGLLAGTFVQTAAVVVGADTTPKVGASSDTTPIGVAAVDVTPDYPIRLSGYGGRRVESEGVAQKIWAKALAIGSDEQSPTILITVDNCGVPASVTEEVAKRLKDKAGIQRERLAVCSTHTHTGPCLTGVLPLLFGSPIPPDEQATIDRYTQELIDKIEQAAFAALKDRKPATLSWSQGTVGFANNRRTAGGPVDDSLPCLFVRSEDTLRAVVVNYACHCTTLGGDFNQIHGDWAGCAAEAIEREHPGAVALVCIGCGADANPHPRLELAHADRHGESIGDEVNRLLKGEQRPVSTQMTCRLERIELPFEQAPSIEFWQTRLHGDNHYAAHHAKVQIQRLRDGQELQSTLDYPVQVWRFGDDLTMAFLAGEVVVDYSLKLKELLGGDRLWINAYANDVPCYIPSKRILREGGYEAERSMIYYDRPARLKPVVEDLIIETVLRLLPEEATD